MSLLKILLIDNPYKQWENKKYEELTLKDKTKLNRILDKELVHMGENGKELFEKVREEELNKYK